MDVIVVPSPRCDTNVGRLEFKDKKRDVSQKIYYLPQINLSPTSNTVVIETLKIAQRIAEKTKKEEICVTYDLAIAKMALQIQAEESPRFDNTLIFVGAFHTEAAYFHALGTFLAESDGPSILIACDILASRSLKGFFIGKYYNRCKRIHPLLASAMELLHFNSFLSSSGCEIDDVVKEELSQILKDNSSIHHTDFDEFLLSKEVRELLDSYEKFKGQTSRGLHVLTAQYWLAYIDLVCIYHNFSRSTRTGNFELYIYSLQMMTNLFFAFNQPNYSQWSVRLHDNLLRINETHPCLSAEFRNGRFGIKRTSKNFSRMPIDLTLEQTINADAAIKSFTNSISARQRSFFKNGCCITSA